MISDEPLAVTPPRTRTSSARSNNSAQREFIEFSAASQYDRVLKSEKSMDTIRFVDTTIRDGHQSLWAENMTTGMMLPVAERLDRAGFDAIELISSSHLKKCVRELKEDPWARVKLMSQRITRTPLRLNAGRFSAFDLTPKSMYRLFMERMAANGIREARISEEWNELEGWTWKCAVANDVGINPVP